jgi:hypothetical protein
MDFADEIDPGAIEKRRDLPVTAFPCDAGLAAAGGGRFKT